MTTGPQSTVVDGPMESAGGVALETVTVTAAAVAVLPAASRVTAVRTWEPSRTVVVFQAMVYGASVTGAPNFIPSSLNCTPATPTLSAAVADTLTVAPTVAPGA